ncbi:glutathione synthase [Pendulispora albinea]|uniref:Glutathione synthetase n=1 Tax=Pendulispora albinea TaxID=2741071 RepID=A0ABZ2LZR7_9BACT
MRFVFVMDPMQRVLPDKDTSFALQRAALKRGHQLLHAELRDLFAKDGDVFARVRGLTVQNTAPFFEYGAESDVRLGEVDAIFIRKDPPFDSEYLYATLLLERARGKTLIVNDPRGLRDANEKLYPLHFSRHMPKTLVATDRERILSFVDEVGGDAVIKPLHGAGGAGVLLLARRDQNARSIIETLTREGAVAAMVQEYLPAVRQGDKRVLLLDGEVLGGINRVPRSDDLRSNIHVGGRVEPCEVTAQERAVVADIAPRLRADGLYFVGLDFIGGKLTEVNVTSPTGIQELSAHQGRDVSEDVIAWVEKHGTSLAAGTKETLRS